MDYLREDPQAKKLDEAKVEEDIRNNTISGLLLSLVLFLLTKQVMKEDNLKEIEDFIGRCGKVIAGGYNIDNLKKEVENFGTNKELDAETQEVMLELIKVQGAGHMGSTKSYVLEIVDRDNRLATAYVNSRKGRSWGKGVGGNNLKSAGSYL